MIGLTFLKELILRKQVNQKQVNQKQKCEIAISIF